MDTILCLDEIFQHIPHAEALGFCDYLPPKYCFYDLCFLHSYVSPHLHSHVYVCNPNTLIFYYTHHFPL